LLPAYALAWAIVEQLGQHEIAAMLLTSYREGERSVNCRAELEVTADRLLAEGDQLGDLLVHALHTWRELDARQAEHLRNRTLDLAVQLGVVGGHVETHYTVRFDLRHTFPAVEWLETLTRRLLAKVNNYGQPGGLNPCGEIQLAPAQPNALVHEDADNRICVHVDGFAYTYQGEHPEAVTAAEIADAFNAQGGPATFSVTDDGAITFTVHTYGQRSVLVQGGTAAAQLGLDGRGRQRRRPELRDQRPQHAPHIGGRLGKRLGVRR
jgi:hypothetical protein